MKVFLIGSFGQNNYGDDLLLDVFLSQFGPVAETIFVNSDEPHKTQALYNKFPLQVVRTGGSKFKILKTLRQCDLVIFAGGNILKELHAAYGGKPYSTLIRIWLIVTYAKLLRKKVIMASIGVGPLKTKWGLKLTKKILQKTDIIAVRDSVSVKYLHSIGIKKPFSLISDAVFSDPAALAMPHNNPILPGSQSGQTIKIGINICRNIDNPANWPSFFRALSEALRELNQKIPNIEYVGLPMQYDTISSNDYLELHKLAKVLIQKDPLINFSLTKPDNYKELVELINGVDIVVAERLHSLITATILHKPFVALSYDDKVEGYITDLGVEMPVIDISKPVSARDIENSIAQVIKDRDHYSQGLMEVAKEKSNQAIEFFNQLHTQLKTQESSK